MKKTISVTIAIPAFNEQENITHILSCILESKLSKNIHSNIIVISDGSTDDTTKLVSNIALIHKNVQLISHKKRLGKVNRLNEIYVQNSSDYLIVLDADILPVGNHFIMDLINEMESNPSLTMCAAHQIPTKTKGLNAESIYAAYKVWDDARLAVPDQNHIQNFYGAATIYRKKFVSHLHIPKMITDERGYIYLMAIREGRFKYSQSAVVLYNPVKTLHDLWKLGDRSFGKNQEILSNIFGSEVYDAYRISIKYKLKSIFSNLVNNPIYTSIGLILNVLIRTFPVHDNLYNSGTWEPARSTKHPIKI